MLVRKISYYDEFHCLMGECPQSCCKGWRIPLDEKAVRRFRSEKGLLGLKLKLAMHGKVQPSFSPYCFRCPFLRFDGKCDMQIRKGETYLAEICRIYPRLSFCTGEYAEQHLDLSCVHVAELFLRHREEQFLVEEYTEDAFLPTGDNDAPEYLEALEKSRGALITLVSEGARNGDPKEFNRLLRKTCAYASAVQDLMMREGVEEAEAIRRGIEGSEDPGEMRWLTQCFPLPIAVINELLSTDFFQEGMQYVQPLLYRLCRMYYKKFDKLDYPGGEKELKRLFRKHIAKDPERVRLYAAYFNSRLLRTYMECYEDYSFLKHMLENVIGINIIMLFEMLWKERYKNVTDRDLAAIIAVCERRIYHNEAVNKQLMKAILKGKE